MGLEGTPLPSPLPTPVPTPEPTPESVGVAVHGTIYGFVILMSEGGVFAYGYGNAGRLGTGTSDDTGFTSSQRLDLNNVVQMDTGQSGGVALTGGGTVHYWPEALGSSTTSGSTTDYDLAEMPTSSFTETSAVRFVRAGGESIGSMFWCAVFENENAPPECWGYNGLYNLAQVRVARRDETCCVTVVAKLTAACTIK
jgi:hypothetical protein